MADSYFLKPFHLDVLKEVGNIGSAHAATALSKLTNQLIDMEVPSVMISTISNVIHAEESEKLVIAAHFELHGDLEAHLFITFEIGEAEQLLRQIVKDSTLCFEDILSSSYYRSALSEIGNIVAGSYITALSDFTQTHLQLSTPQLGLDMAGALIGEGLIDVSLHGDDVILIDTVLKNRETKHAIKGSFLLLPKPDFIDFLFEKLGVDT